MPIPPSKIEPFPVRNPFSSEFWDTLNVVGELAARYAEREAMIEESFTRRETGGGGEPSVGTVIPVLQRETSPEVKRNSNHPNYDGPVEWIYADWVEVERVSDSGDLAAWAVKADGHSGAEDGPLTNVCEIQPIGPEHGSGYNYDEIPDGFDIRPIPARILFVHAIPMATDPDALRYWFDIPNKLGGSCP